MLDWLSDEAKGTGIALVGSAAILDFELLEKLPKGALVTIIVGCAAALSWFVKRDLKKLGDKDDHVSELHDEVVSLKTEVKLLREELRIVSEKVVYERPPDGPRFINGG